MIYNTPVYKEITNDNKIRIYIEGQREDIKGTFWQFLNYDCINWQPIDFEDIEDFSGFNWINEDISGYFNTNKEKLLNGLAGMFLMRILKEKDPHVYLLTNEESELFKQCQLEAQNKALQYFEELPEKHIESWLDLEENLT